MNFAKTCILATYCCVIRETEADNASTSVNDDKSLISGRKFPKLTVKQGLIMNQIISTYAISNSKDPSCRNHVEAFKNGLRALEPWAIKMFDSSSKLQSSVLMGNLVEYGDFKQCLSIFRKSENFVIRGKHCALRIKPGVRLLETVLRFRNISHKRFEKLRSGVIEGVQLVWSVCVPDSCSAEETLVHFNKSIMEVAEGLDIKVSLVEANCASVQTLPEWGLLESSFLLVGIAIVLAVLVSTIIDYNGFSTNQFAQIFSAISNWRRLISKGTNQWTMELDCLHGIRFISVCYVMFGHRFMTGMLFPSTNSLDLVDWILDYTSTPVIGGTVSVDSFLLVSGILVSYGFFQKVTCDGKFNIVHFYLQRYIRITFPLTIPLILYCFFIQHFGSGPLWFDTYQSMQKPCKSFWWSTLLHIQNYVNPDFLCIPQTWYLTCEMCYYYFSILILYPLHKRRNLGLANLAFIYILSVGVNFYLAWTNEYVGGMPLTNQLFHTHYFQRHYITPHVRASPYIIGLGFGYAIFRTKDSKMKMNFGISWAGWITSIIFMSAAVVGSHVFQEENHHYNRLESSLFLSCSRSAWVLGIAWIIWTCSHGQGGIVNRFLSFHVFRVLGRVGYGVFLFHLGFQFLKAGAAKGPDYYSNFQMIYECCADLIVNLVVGLLFTLCFEYPCLVIERKLFRRKKV